MTNNAFLIKIIPPQGYNVYRLHLSRTAAAGLALAVVLLVAGALGFHAWQLHVADENVAALKLLASEQGEKLRAIDKQAESLAGQLRDIQRQDDQIRKLLGVGAASLAGSTGRGASPGTAAPNRPVPTTGQHAASGLTSRSHALSLGGVGAKSAPPLAIAGVVPANAVGAVTVSAVQARLARLSDASQQRLAERRSFNRLAERVLNVRKVAAAARMRMIAALPSINPVGGGIAAAFGWRVNPWPEFHRGLDLEADYGTPVHAAADGVVATAGWDGGFGNKVDVDHDNGYHTWYAHLSRFAVTAGQHVRKGDVIAYVGATGEVTGPHLHYQVMLGGQAIDPAPYLNGIPAKVLATLPSAARVQ